MKIFFAVGSAILMTGISYGQSVVVGSDDYDSLKMSGNLDGVSLFSDLSLFDPAGQRPNISEASGSGSRSVCDCYVEPDGTYIVAMGPNDDGSTGLINIPFNFCFYGNTYNSFYINNNGNVTFTSPLAAFSATAFPSVGNEILAPFWGDVDTRNGNGQVLYKITPTAIYINWEDVGYYSQHGDKLNTFQLIITDGADPVVQGGNVAFCYQDMQWTTGDASQGVNGFGGIPATCGANKGDGISYFLISRFDHAGTDFDGALGNPDGISWLDYKSFYFDACNTSNVPPIPEGISSCDTFRVCSFGDTADISISFLSPEIGQTTSISYSNGGLTSLQEISNTSGNTASLILRIIGDPGAAGTYAITVTGTDDFSPIPGTTTITFTIVIEDTGSPSGTLSPTQGCDSVLVDVLPGPYDTYLWDDFTTDTTAYVSSSGVHGVTVSLNGCYTRITDTFDIAVAPIFNLQGNLNVCGGSGTPLHIPDSLNLGPVNWNLGNPALDNLYSNTLTSGTYTITLWDSLSLCSTDTTFDVTLTNPSTMMGDTTLCTGVMDFQVTGQAGNPAGNWFSASPEISFSNNAVPEPLISATAYGTYTVTYGDICGDTLSADITFASPPTIFPDTSTCSLSFAVSGTDVFSTGGVWSSPDPEISFSPNTTTTNPTINATQGGMYTIDFTDNVCGNMATTTIELMGPPVIFPDTIACSSLLEITGTQSYNGGVWAASDTSIHFTGTQILNPNAWTIYPGMYTFTFTDTVCNVSTSSLVEFIADPWTEIFDTVICEGSQYEIFANDNETIDAFSWSTGDLTSSTVVSQPSTYTVTVTNICGSYTAAAEIGTKVCDIEAPNIISLSSQVGNNIWFVQYEGLTEFRCTIMNRWGNVIYVFTDPNAGWSGQTNSGQLVEEGTYFYKIWSKLESGEELTKKGFIQVVH